MCESTVYSTDGDIIIEDVLLYQNYIKINGEKIDSSCYWVRKKHLKER